ncbi:MAG: 3'-5' exonuclease [Polyangiaceae bacterium]
MSDQWILSMKPTFLTELLALPPKEAHQVQEKLALLVADPRPDAKVKKQLRHLDGKLHRLRSGDHRIFYTFDDRYVSALALRRRKEDTYDEEIDSEFLGGLDPEIGAKNRAQAGSAWIAPSGSRSVARVSRPLPTPITEALLKRLRVPSAYAPRLLTVADEDELLNCAGVPDDVLLRVDEALFERPLEQVLSQPDLVTSSVDDLLKYRDGSLLGFLLRLNPEQEKHTRWSSKTTGPTLLKGGPGTGKSTVALYRVRAMIEGLRKGGLKTPRILFTTYTNALVKFSQQLLMQLLGADAKLVDVRTADSVVREIAFGDQELPLADNARQREVLDAVCATLTFEGNRLQQRAQAQAISRLPREYLLEELNTVIDARRLASLDAYLAAPRPGRQLSLNATQRTAVWRAHTAYVAALEKLELLTWQQIRGRAAQIVEAGKAPRTWDGVVIDEVQDLDPAAVQTLVGLSKAPNRLFLTADANQSVYGGAFRWTDLHEGLRFTGRVGVLRANHRSTREVGEAARHYLNHIAGALVDPGETPDEATPEYVHTGPLPVVRAVASAEDEAALLARFLPGAAREYHLGQNSCAVFCPTNDTGRKLAERLVHLGVQATFMESKHLDLSRQGVKVMTLKSCKGLEFPVVALAGFGEGTWPVVPADATDDDRAELIARERRTVFVGMTRAMRALLVVVPEGADTPLLQGFAPARWNTGAEPAPSEAT